MSKRRAAIILVTAFLSVVIVSVAIASGSKPAPAIAYPDAKPTPVVCSNAGACFEADNKANGISARLGHSKPTTPLAIYSHAMEGGQDIASKAMGELLKTVSDSSR